MEFFLSVRFDYQRFLCHFFTSSASLRYSILSASRHYCLKGIPSLREPPVLEAFVWRLSFVVSDEFVETAELEGDWLRDAGLDIYLLLTAKPLPLLVLQSDRVLTGVEGDLVVSYLLA